MSTLSKLLAALFAVTTLFAAETSSGDAADRGLQGFGPISETGDAGWLMAGARLYWTADAGASWRDITPAVLAGSEIAAAEFVGQRGWIVTAVPSADGAAIYRLATTTDTGATWQQSMLGLFAAGEPGDYPAALYLDFVDSRHGWLVVKHLTSSNFSRGDLYRTTDGGATWERLTIPLGEPVRFEDERSGTVSGGPTGTEAYRTIDGGATWQPVEPGAASVDAAPALPRGDITAVVRGAGQAAWAVYRRGTCDPSAHTCHVEVGLLSTADAGRTWMAMPLPEGVRASEEFAVPDARAAASQAGPQVAPAPQVALAPQVMPAPRTQAMTGYGFDKCEVADPLILQDWSINSPYDAVNLYIGGSARACSNRALNYALLGTLANQGWRFIPTWVGPQAPCYGTARLRMSADPATAYSQGLNEANLAADTLKQLGLTEPDGTGSIAYYDMEYYNVQDAACHEAVRSFISGWVHQLHVRGNVAGVYGTGSTLSNFANQAEPPDAIWAANWIRDSFDPAVTVWDVYRLSNTLWANRQRLRQYTGGHAESWGYNTLTIDSDVLNGIVASLLPPPPPLPRRAYLPDVSR